jgi:hypothetical protein
VAGLGRRGVASLTLAIQHDEPTTPEARANWLPAPHGPSYLGLRLYLPDRTALAGTWHPPPVRRID